MVRGKNIMKIIAIITSIAMIGYTFARFTNMVEPTGTIVIYIAMYFVVISLSIILNFMPDRVINLNKIKDRVEYNEFQNIYQELLINHKEQLDKYRRQIAVKRIIQGILVVIFTLVWIAIKLEWTVYLNPTFALSTSYIAIGTAIMLVGSFFVNTKAETLYKKLYKENIIGTLIKALGKDLVYSANSENQANVLNAYAKAGFDITTYNRSQVDDYISGYLDAELTVSMADLHLKRVSGSGKNRRVVTIFSGMFVDITATKNIGATIKILTNRNKKHSKIDLLDKKYEKIDMDSQTFEKYFNVYADNKIVAMQFLTSEILEMLTELRNTFGVDLEIVINNEHIYLRFRTGEMFEASIFGSSIKRNDLLTYYGVLKMVVLISKKINEIIVNVDV